MIQFSDIMQLTLAQLTDELAAAGWESTQTELHVARSACARLVNEFGNLRLYDSETGDLVTSEVTDEQAAESAQTIEGHILVDARKCHVSDTK